MLTSKGSGLGLSPMKPREKQCYQGSRPPRRWSSQNPGPPIRSRPR